MHSQSSHGCPWRSLSELQPHRSGFYASAQHDSPETIQYHHTRRYTAALGSSRHLLSDNFMYTALQRGVGDILMCPGVRQVLQRWGECSLVPLFQLPALTASRLKHPDDVDLEKNRPTSARCTRQVLVHQYIGVKKLRAVLSI